MCRLGLFVFFTFARKESTVLRVDNERNKRDCNACIFATCWISVYKCQVQHLEIEERGGGE